LLDWIREASLSDYGSIASLVGLTISAFTLVLLAALRKKFYFNSRLEEHRDSLRVLSSDVSRLFEAFDSNLADIDDKFAIINVKLRMIQKGATSELLSDVKCARRKIRRFRLRGRLNVSFYQPNEKLARLIYTDINIIVEELFNVEKNIMVGG
jgi:hypothetical protein